MTAAADGSLEGRPPLSWRRIRAMLRIARSALWRYWADDGDAMAGYIAYSTFLSIFPFAIFATAVTGAIIGPEDGERVVDALFELAPPHVAQTLAPVIEGVTAGVRDGVITVSVLLGFWFASNAVESIRVAFDRAYGARTPRGFFARRVRALGFVLLATATFVLLGALIIVAPIALTVAERELGFHTPVGVGLVRYAVGLPMLALFLFELHLLLPSARPPRRRLWPGIWVSTALWTLGAIGFQLYLTLAPSFAITYGALAGVIVTLLFFYLTGAAIILGAEVNAALMAFRRPSARDRAA